MSGGSTPPGSINLALFVQWRTMQTRHCNKCNTTKPLDEFHKCSSQKLGVQSQCKECRNSITRRIAAKRYRDDPVYKQRRNARMIDYSRIRKYEVTPEKYSEMVETQKGKCAICNGVNKNGKHLHIDHCHKTGKVRGLLCMHCNNGLGAFKDNLTLLELAKRYLENTK